MIIQLTTKHYSIGLNTTNERAILMRLGETKAMAFVGPKSYERFMLALGIDFIGMTRKLTMEELDDTLNTLYETFLPQFTQYLPGFGPEDGDSLTKDERK